MKPVPRKCNLEKKTAVVEKKRKIKVASESSASVPKKRQLKKNSTSSSVAKRRKIEKKSPPPSSTSPAASVAAATTSSSTHSPFLALHDDCIEKILDFLPPDDLCSISSTSQRMQNITNDHFRRKYSTKFPNLKVFLDKEPKTGKIVHRLNLDEKFLEHFLSFVQISCIESDKIALKDVMDFTKSIYNEKLKSPEICFGGRVDPIDIEQYKKQLKHLDRVSLSDYFDSDIHANLLTHCPNLQHLGIETYDEGKTDWMTKVYPNLKSVSFCFDDTFHRRAFKKVAQQFFNHHKQVKEITCSDTPTIKSVLEYVTDIERLTLKFEYFNDKKFIAYLEDHFQQNPVKRFGLEIEHASGGIDFIHKFNSAQPIHDLTLRNIFLGRVAYYGFNTLTHLINLSILIVTPFYGQMCRTLRLSLYLPGQLPNLETFDMTISTKEYGFEKELNPYDDELVPWKCFDYLLHGNHCNEGKLRKITYRIYSNIQMRYEAHELIEWNAERSKIPNAAPIDIELEYPADYIYDLPKFKIPDAENRLVNLKIYRGYRMSEDDDENSNDNDHSEEK